MPTRYRSPLGQINGFCRVGHSSSVGTSFLDVLQRQLLQQLVMWRLLTNKLARQLKTRPVKLQFWPLTGSLRIIGFLDASYRNNEDGSSQRGMTVSSAKLREHSAKDGISYGSIANYESQKIKRTVLSTTVAELYSFMKCFVSCQFFRGLWMDMSSEVAEIHMRTDAKNLVTTARTIPLPEQKRNNSHDFHVAKWNLFRKYSWPCSHFNSELFSRKLDDVIDEGRQFDHSSENSEVIGSWRSSKLQDSHVAQGILVYMV